MLRIIGFWATISKMSTLENKRFWYFLLIQQLFLYFYPSYLTTATLKPFNYTIFWKNSIKFFIYLQKKLISVILKNSFLSFYIKNYSLPPTLLFLFLNMKNSLLCKGSNSPIQRKNYWVLRIATTLWNAI